MALPSAERGEAVAQGRSRFSEVRRLLSPGLEFTPEKDGECLDSGVGGQVWPGWRSEQGAVMKTEVPGLQPFRRRRVALGPSFPSLPLCLRSQRCSRPRSRSRTRSTRARPC